MALRMARIIARRYGEQSEKDSDKSKDLGEELADVLFVVVCLANQTGVDLQEAWDKRMAKKTSRDKEHKTDLVPTVRSGILVPAQLDLLSGIPCDTLPASLLPHSITVLSRPLRYLYEGQGL